MDRAPSSSSPSSSSSSMKKGQTQSILTMSDFTSDRVAEDIAQQSAAEWRKALPEVKTAAQAMTTCELYRPEYPPCMECKGTDYVVNRAAGTHL